MTDTTNPDAQPDDAGTATQPASRWDFKPHPPGKGPKPMRWNAEKADTLQRHMAAITENAAATEDARTEAANRGADEGAHGHTLATSGQGQDDTGDDLGLSREDYAAAAETMAEEAAQGRENAASDESTDEDSTDDGTPETDGRDDKYRARLRDAEAENDRLNSLVESMLNDEVARLAAPRLADAADLFRDGLTVADLCDQTGRVDPARVERAADALLSEHPHWRAPVAPYRGPLRSGSTSVPFDGPGKSFASAFAPKPE
jgi:hypothetical protein